MTHFKRAMLIGTCAAMIPLGVGAQQQGTSDTAQEDEGPGYLAGLLESALSGAGRQVQIRGFAGALSSQATIETIRISDDEGIWLELRDITLDWSRAQLLRGVVDVQALTAADVTLSRLPAPGEAPLEAPDAQASGFSLPDLPVSIGIERLGIDRLELGEAVLGTAATLQLDASASLAEGSGAAKLSGSRIDGVSGTFTLDAGFEAETELLRLILNLDEAEGGLAARTLDLPGLPSVELSVNGEGPLDDLQTNLFLATDGDERLSGLIRLSGQEDGRAFSADLSGDVTALFLPEYRDFFGEQIALRASGLQATDGALRIDELDLRSRAVSLTGNVALAAGGAPDRLDLRGRIALDDGGSVLLPISGPPTRIDAAVLDVQFDASQGDDLQARVDLTGLDRPDLSVETASLVLDGTVTSDAGAIEALKSEIVFDLRGLDLDDPAVASALGRDMRGRVDLDYAPESPLTLQNLKLEAAGLELSGDVRVGELTGGFPTSLDLTLQADDIERFSDLAGQSLTGQVDVSAVGDIAPLAGTFELTIDGAAQGLSTGIAQLDALLSGRTRLSLAAKRDLEGTELPRFSLANEQVSLTGSANLQAQDGDAQFKLALADGRVVDDRLEGPLDIEGSAVQSAGVWNADLTAAGPLGINARIDGTVAGAPLDIMIDMGIKELGGLVPQLDGQATIKGQVTQPGEAIVVDVTAKAPLGIEADIKGPVTGSDVVIEIAARIADLAPFVVQLPGPARVEGTVRQDGDAWIVDLDSQAPQGISARLQGPVTGPAPTVAFDARIADLSPFVAQLPGPARARGTAAQRDAIWQITVDATAPKGISATVSGPVTGDAPTIAFDARITDLAPFVAQLPGPARSSGEARQRDGIWSVDASAAGPEGLKANVSGPVTGDDVLIAFDAGIANLGAFVPQLPGAASASGEARQSGAEWAVDVDAKAPQGITAQVSGPVTGPNADIALKARVPNVSTFVSQLSGALELAANAARAGNAWSVDASVDGPGGARLTTSGIVRDDTTVDLTLKGGAPLALANPFLVPRTLSGAAEFDLSINGPPALSSVKGTVTASQGRLFDPSARAALENIVAYIALNGERALLDVNGRISSGGQIRVQGPVTLSGGFDSQIDVTLDAVRLVDPTLYKTQLQGALQLRGPLTGGANVSGRIDIGETEITVPASGFSSFGEIPEITYVGTPGSVRASQRRAGIGITDSSNGGGPARPFGLDVFISAPQKIFIRGRGIDAELGGDVRVTGTTNNVITAGRFDLIRGRIDILERRFDFDEGAIILQGSLNPAIRLVAITDTDAGTASIIVDGNVASPSVTFSSDPEAPQDEVLAQLFFGRPISELSALQALQLANAVATLAGRGGEGVVSKLRKGFGLDDLDVVNGDSGGTAVRAGKYISENIYTDVVVGTREDSSVSLNLDITPSITARGQVKGDGNTSVGVFFERDY